MGEVFTIIRSGDNFVAGVAATADLAEQFIATLRPNRREEYSVEPMEVIERVPGSEKLTERWVGTMRVWKQGKTIHTFDGGMMQAGYIYRRGGRVAFRLHTDSDVVTIVAEDVSEKACREALTDGVAAFKAVLESKKGTGTSVLYMALGEIRADKIGREAE